MPKPAHNYDESKIQTLSALEHIRKRTGMYIGRVGDGTQYDDGIYVLLKEVVEGLPQPLRDTFMLSRHAGMSYAEISAHTGAPIKTVEARMSRALALLAARMRD